MLAGLKRVLPAAAVVLFALALPSAALAKAASGCKASACKVYTEPAGSAGGQQSKTGGDGVATKPLPIPPKTSRLLAHAGKDKAVLSNLISNPAYRTKPRLENSGLGSIASPSALSAAFDLGAGPLALLAILFASALGLAVHQGLRGRRRRRAVP